MLISKYKLKISIALGGVFLFSFSFFSVTGSSAFADSCVTNTSVHGYGGLIVNSRWHKYGEPDNVFHQSNNTDVRVSTHGSTESPPGNVVRLGSGPEGVVDRRDTVTFDQINLSYCDYNSAANDAGVSGEAPGDTINAVLGDSITTTSSPAGSSTSKPWAIDCDASKHGIGNEQLIKITGVGVPTGARAGGTWSSSIERIPNGKTTLRTITYTEPPPVPDNSDCNVYEHDVYDNSVHKFSVFGINASLNPTSPGDGNVHSTRDLTNDGVVNITWANGMPPPVYVLDLDPTHDYKRVINIANLGPSDSGWQVVYERWQAVSGGDYKYYREIKTIPNCHTADIDDPGLDCSSVSIQADRPTGGNGSSVKAGTNFTISGKVANTGQRALPISVVVIDGGGMAGNQYDVGNLDQGLKADFDIRMTAINDVSHRIVTIVPKYNGNGFELGPRCTVEVDTYQQFSITPTATLDSTRTDNENPTTIYYTYGGAKQFGPDTVSAGRYSIAEASATTGDPVNLAPGDTTSNITSTNTNLPYQNQSIDGTYSNSNIRNTVSVGERYCIITTINEANGWLGPHGKVGVSSDSRNSCARVVNKPYVRMYGQDVFAGGAFQNGTPSGDQSIRTSNKPDGTGSGVEYAAFAMGSISGYVSSSLRADGLFDQLNFATGPPKGGFGGDHVVSDYFKYLPINASDDVSALDGDAPRIVSQTGNITLSGRSISGRKSLFVDGNVYITGNIVLSGDNSWSNANDVPSFALIVRGNIYIAPNVTRIDGLLVAQPNGSNLGEIRTCTTDIGGTTGDLTTDGTNGQCSNQLTFNGALVAKKIKWLRTHRTLSNSQSSREPYNNTSAAEIVNTPPDFYVAQPSYLPNTGGTSGKYDAYQALPPIL